MADPTKPPFHADHVGSLVRPAHLRELRDRFEKGEIGRGGLRETEDAEIRKAIAMQERVGLPAVTDGEFRRKNFREGFWEAVDGFSEERVPTDFEFVYADGTTRRATPVPKVASRLKRRQGMATGELAFLQQETKGIPKVCLPAPSIVHWFIGDASLTGSVYATAQEYMADVAAIYREEITELGRMGAAYVQFDEVAIPIMCDPKVQAIIRGRGEDHEALIDLYIGTINEAIRARPPGMTICLHMCRGNEGEGIGSGGYDAIAERVFNTLQVDGYLLEFDTPRAGDFNPLRFMPKEKKAALGLISTKNPELESKAELKARVEEAAKFMDLDRLGLCPQCGFASLYRYARFTEEDQERKLSRLVETAAEIW